VESNTITDVVVCTHDFNTLETAALKAGVQTTLSDTGPFTVIALITQLLLLPVLPAPLSMY
jgi:hypothetical protein